MNSAGMRREMEGFKWTLYFSSARAQNCMHKLIGGYFLNIKPGAKCSSGPCSWDPVPWVRF